MVKDLPCSVQRSSSNPLAYFEVLTAVYDVTPCGLARLRGTCSIHLESERQELSTRLQGITSQTTIIFKEAFCYRHMTRKFINAINLLLR
jgi:hypothetical protein